MIDDVYEPLEQYAADFKEAHANRTSEFFEDLVRQSGVDETANADTVQKLRELEHLTEGGRSTNKRWQIVRGILIAVALLVFFYVFTHYFWLWLIVPTAIFVPAIYRINRVINDSHARLKQLEQACEEKRAKAWGQMAPLNRLYDWDIAAKLIQETVPRIVFDPYFSNGRMDELRNSFGWSGELGNTHSIVYSYSGELNGNPFILARTLTHWMGCKTYSGSLEISWTERVRDFNGKQHTETRHETLHASLERPFPEYDNQTFIIYGNEAAPDLVFNRKPSKLSKLKDGYFDTMKKNRAIKRLEKKSRDMGEGKTFTVMDNREFDALFGATNRNHEVQFRLLFTPLAQQELLKLLKDGQVGYGDDFLFDKNNMINVVEPAHMRRTDIGGEPQKFYAYELAQARTFFNSYNNDFFRSFYFGIAPLLAIPLYQQHRSHADIYKDIYASQSCFWEHEAIANFYGEAAFEHPNCVTRSILKTASQIEADGSQTVHVTASGYKCVERVDYVTVRGGDGNYHEVPVHWSEYLDVQRTSDMVVLEKMPPGKDGGNSGTDREEDISRKVFEQRGVEYQNAILHRSIVSAILPN